MAAQNMAEQSRVLVNQIHHLQQLQATNQQQQQMQETIIQLHCHDHFSS